MLLFEESSEESDEHDDKKIKLKSNSRIEHLFILKKIKFIHKFTLCTVFKKYAEFRILKNHPEKIGMV